MKFPAEIIQENERWLAINKPAGLLSVPDREGREVSLKSLLREKYGEIFTVHRIDRETSGLILFAKDESTHRFLSGLFENRQVEKFYLGMVHGIMPEKEKRMEWPIMEHSGIRGKMIVHQKGKTAITTYEVLETFSLYSLLRFQIFTGRTHQIRVHMQQEGHPLLGDPLYGDGKPVYLSSFKKKYKLSKKEEEERPILNRLALHANRLCFTDIDGSNIDLQAPLPKDMDVLIKQLRKNT